MGTEQINLKISPNLLKAAESYAERYGYRSLQELISESMREKIFEKNEFDESFSEKEVGLIDSLIELGIRNKCFSTEEEMDSILLG